MYLKCLENDPQINRFAKENYQVIIYKTPQVEVGYGIFSSFGDDNVFDPTPSIIIQEGGKIKEYLSLKFDLNLEGLIHNYNIDAEKLRGNIAKLKKYLTTHFDDN